MKRFLAIILILSILLSGCSSSRKTVHIGYDIDEDTHNIDPQFATDRTAKVVIMNIFEGLVVRNPEGEIFPGAASRWEISPDQKTYTFYLREDVMWNDLMGEDMENIPVTAHDFEFALSRIFNKEAPSPYAEEFSSIKNAKAILGGTEYIDSLGVKAVSNDVLKVELDEKDDFFLYKLASSAAMPCNEEFFNKTKGRYGLESSLILENGPFYMARWESEHRITMNANPNYKGENPVEVSSVDLYVQREDTQSRFTSSKTDLIFADAEFAQQIKSSVDWQVVPVEDTVWALQFDVGDADWGAVPLRQAMACLMQRDNINRILNSQIEDEKLGARYNPTGSIFTNEIKVGKVDVGESYEDTLILGDNFSKGMQLFEQGLETLDEERISFTTLYYPDQPVHREVLEMLRDFWYKNGISITLYAVEEPDYNEFLETENIQIALVPIKLDSSSPQSVLQKFSTSSNFLDMDYNNSIYDALLQRAEESNNIEQRIENYAAAQRLLLTDAVVIPVYTEKSCYAVSSNAKNIDVYPLDKLVRFHPAGYSE